MKRLSVSIVCLCGMAGVGYADVIKSDDNPMGVLSLSQLDATRQRPLFSPSRLPPAPPPQPIELPVVQAHETPPTPPAVVLLGVVTTIAGPQAIIKPTPTEKARTIHIGDEIAGWKATEIEPRRIVLVHDTQSSDIALFDPKATNAPMVAAVREKPKKKRRQQ